MDVIAAGTAEGRRGPAEWFTGAVVLEPLVEAAPPARVRVARVTFEPGARTAWHRHPLGQALHVVAGVALVGLSDGTARRVAAGDSVWFDPGERHWHGAAPDGPMTHLAVQEADAEGSTASWEEHVSDEEYTRAAEAAR